MWDPGTGHDLVLPAASPKRTGKQVLSVAFSPDGHLLAAADDETVALWDITSLAHPHLVSTLSGAVANVTDLAYSPACTMIAGEESDGDVLLWNLDQDTRMLLPGAVSASRGLAFSGDGTILITAGSYSDMMMWDTRSGQHVSSPARRVPGDTIALAYSAASGTLALGVTRWWLWPPKSTRHPRDPGRAGPRHL